MSTLTQLNVNLPWISKKSSAMTGGPLSIGLPDPLNTRPGKRDNMNYYVTEVQSDDKLYGLMYL